MVQLAITDEITIDDSELEWQFIRSSGAGGQNVNKVSTAAQLIFDIRASSLAELYQQRLLAKADHRITQSGKIIIKCQQSRSQLMNRESALEQFLELVKSVTISRKRRIATRPSKASKERRVNFKKQRGDIKSMRKKPL